MKIVTIDNLFFKLPDDFKGSLAEALRLLADYVESPIPPQQDAFDIKPPEVNIEAWKHFLGVTVKGGRMYGVFSVQELVDGKWETKT